MEFSALERGVIERILSQPVEGMDVVRKQFTAASVTERDYTGAGFYTTISVPRSVPAVPRNEELVKALRDGITGVASSAPQHAVLFLLWLERGYLSCLEGATTDGCWPDERSITLSDL